MFFRHPILSLGTFAYLCFVAWMTLTPQTAGGASLMTRIANRVVIELGRHDATAGLTVSEIEFLANVAMFVPIGLFFLLLFGRNQWWLAMLGGIVLTLAIEYAQQSIPGRVSDPRDLVANGAGTLIGVVLGWVLTVTELFTRRRSRNSRR